MRCRRCSSCRWWPSGLSRRRSSGLQVPVTWHWSQRGARDRVRARARSSLAGVGLRARVAVVAGRAVGDARIRRGAEAGLARLARVVPVRRTRGHAGAADVAEAGIQRCGRARPGRWVARASRVARGGRGAGDGAPRGARARLARALEIALVRVRARRPVGDGRVRGRTHAGLARLARVCPVRRARRHARPPNDARARWARERAEPVLARHCRAGVHEHLRRGDRPRELRRVHGDERVRSDEERLHLGTGAQIRSPTTCRGTGRAPWP